MTNGFFYPRTATGRASIVPAPPWHYSGDLLTIEYRAAAGSVARWLPDPLEPAEDDPDAVAVIFADWQSCSDSFEELADPIRSQYKEAFVVVRCRYDGETFSGAVLTDTVIELPFTVHAVADTPVRHLRVGQRVRIETAGSGAELSSTKVEFATRL